MLSRVWLFATPWTVACQASLAMGFSMQEYWSGLPFPSPGELPDSGIEPGSPALAGRFFNNWATREALYYDMANSKEDSGLKAVARPQSSSPGWGRGVGVGSSEPSSAPPCPPPPALPRTPRLVLTSAWAFATALKGTWMRLRRSEPRLAFPCPFHLCLSHCPARSPQLLARAPQCPWGLHPCVNIILASVPSPSWVHWKQDSQGPASLLRARLISGNQEASAGSSF